MRHPIIFCIAIVWFSFSTIAPAQAQWVNTGLDSAFVTALAVSGTNLFAGDGVGSGVFLSTNNGTSWKAANNGLTDTEVNALVVNDSNLFAGTVYRGVFLSTDNGTSWTSAGIDSIDVHTLAVSGTNLFAGTYTRGVFRSTNNGTSWIAVDSGMTDTTAVDALTFSGTNLFAGTSGSGVYLSTNNGTSWTAINSGLTDAFVNAIVVSDSNLFAATADSGVFRSTNNGASWTMVNNGITSTHVLSLVVSGSNLFAGTVGGNTVYISTNNGTSWTAVNNGLTVTDGVSFEVSGTNLFIGTSSGVYRRPLSEMIPQPTNDSGWVLTDGPNQPYCFATIGTNLFAGTIDSGVFLSTNNGTSWTSSGLVGYTVYALEASDSNLFAGIDGGTYLSTNNGVSWNTSDSGLTNLTNVAVLNFALIGTNLFAGTNGAGVFLSTNHGTSWIADSNGLTNIGNAVWALTANGSNLFAGTFYGGIFLSTNNGTSWIAVNNGLPSDSSSHNYQRISAFGAIGTNLFAGTPSGIFLSTNNGTRWTAVNSGFGIDSDVIAFATSGTNLFAGTFGGGVYLSTNKGASWTAVNSGLTDPYIYALVVSDSDLFAGTGIGVWRRPLSEMIPPATSDTQTISLSEDTSVKVSGDSVGAKPHRINLVNKSNETVTVLSTALTHSNNRFSIAQVLPGIPDTVAPGATFSIIVNFTGDTSGTVYLDTINMLIDPNEESTSYSVYLQGNSFGTSTGVLFASQDTLDFGPAPVSSTVKDTLTLSNSNAVSVTITSYHLSPAIGAFSIIDSSTHVVSYGTNALVILSFHPDTAGSYSDSLTLTLAGAITPSLTLYLSGLGVKGILSVAPTTLNFGSVMVGNDSTRSIELRNTGQASLMIDSITITGAKDAGFSHGTFHLPATISAGDSASLPLTFAPTAEGNYTGSVRLTLGDGTESNISLQGVGAASGVSQNSPIAPTGLLIYPNPFSQSTEITFTSPSAGYAEVSIVNMLGVEVARLFSGDLGAGEHTYLWGNPTGLPGLPDGTYECLVRMNGQAETLPVVLMR
jgi:hypothetical protein